MYAINKVQVRCGEDKLVGFTLNMDIITNDNIELIAWQQTKSIVYICNSMHTHTHVYCYQWYILVWLKLSVRMI